MPRILTPNPSFNGERVGLKFRHGVATAEVLTPEQRTAFKKFGYTIENDEGGSLEDLTIPELRDLADERGVDLTGITRKADIIEALEP